MSVFETAKKIVGGDVAHNAADAGSPVKIGGYASSTAPAAADEGDRVNAWFDLQGRLQVVNAGPSELFPGTLTPLHQRLSSGQQLNADMAWAGPTSGGIRLVDVIFSTDTACSLQLHQSTMATYEAAVTADGAVHFWRLDEVSGNAIDQIGSLDLTAEGSPTYSSASQVCADGAAVGFDGTNDAFAVADKPASCAAGGVEAWVYMSTVDGECVLSICDTDTTNHDLQFKIADGVPQFQLKVSGTALMVAVSNYVMRAGQWYHVVWQHDGTGLDIYVNGRLTTLTYTSGSSATTSWYDDLYAFADTTALGVLRRSTNLLWFAGRIQNVAWYNAALSADIIRAHFELGAPLFGPHYFAASAGVAHPLRTPLALVDGAAVYAKTSAAGNSTLDLHGYED